MRLGYEGWIEAPSPLHADSRVFPPSGLSPAATDEAMRDFPYEVLAAKPRPRALVLDQNLRSQVSRRDNAITGTKIARTLRAGGYTGTIVIRSANVSATARFCLNLLLFLEPWFQFFRCVNREPVNPCCKKNHRREQPFVPVTQLLTATHRPCFFTTWVHGSGFKQGKS